MNYIKEETDYNILNLDSLSDDELAKIYDIICDIEVDETIKADEENEDLSERGKTAESIVTVIGNEFYKDDYECDN